jgi:hypothetical protein
MTREEASFILANIDRRVCDDELSEALDMAIKALEQEPCEDAVSREEAFEELNSLNGTAELDMAFEVIEKLPSVTPTRKKGKWIAKSFHEVYCDNCKFDFDIMTNEFIDKMKYCPNCGAKMESEDKE